MNYIPGTFELLAHDGHARVGLLHTAHGIVETPVFMPVGTVGSVKALAPDDLDNVGAQIILGNTYHLYLRPGDALIARHGGLHEFISWNRPILTDSGGFQAFRLSALNRQNANGVEFRSHIDGSKHMFTPEKVIAIQRNLGSDIMMPLDICLGYGTSFDDAQKAAKRTVEWAQRCREAYPPSRGTQLLFGIVQGCTFPELRQTTAAQLMNIGFEGYAIGGLAVGEPKYLMLKNLHALHPVLPADKPRYLMGVGTPLDILHGIEMGVDMFDCVLPTRNARNGTLYTSQGKINIKRRQYAEDDSPLDPNCRCYTCRTFSKAYLRHLYVSQEILALRLNSLHNLTYFLDMMKGARNAIYEGRYEAFRKAYEAVYPEEAHLFTEPAL